MAFTSTRLDAFVSKHLNISKKEVRFLAAQKKLLVDHQPCSQLNLPVRQFTHVSVDGQVLQENTPRYVMLHKPRGVVSATKDDQHKTVIDLLPYSYRHELHIAGRLDLSSTGLLLLTNDSEWSRALSSPKSAIVKKYRVTLEKPINQGYVDAFSQGMYFPYEDITLKPVNMQILSDHIAELYLCEGRYHQIKRMFGRFRNPVNSIHRVSIGRISLPDKLLEGQSQTLSVDEISL